jgi:glucose-1-phosphate thymidylyltransferase
VILNAGLGTRLRPITPATPKALVPVMDRPLIDYAVAFLEAQGITELVVVVSPGDVATLQRAKDVASRGVTVHAAEQVEPDGIGSAAITPGALLDGRDVAVLASDTLLIGDAGEYMRAFSESGADAGLVLAHVEDPRAFGVAELEGDRVVSLEEKPERPRSDLALVGLWLLGARAIERLRTDPVINAKDERDLTGTIAALVDEGADVRGWEASGRWLDAGTVEGLLQAHDELLEGLAPSGTLDVVGLDCNVDGPLAVGPGVRAVRSRLRGPVLLGASVHVEESEIAHSVVCEGASVRGARLERCVVLPGASVVAGNYHDVVITAEGEMGGPGASSEQRAD